MNNTDVYSVRLSTRVHAIAELLIKRHPHTLSHSWFYQEGVMAAYDKAIKNGENLPGDPFGELIEINNEEIIRVQAIIDRLTNLQKKHIELSSNTLAGSGYKRKTVLIPNGRGGFDEAVCDD